MTFLQHQLDHYNQELTYHQEQIASIEEQIDNVRIAQEYGEQATASVEEAIEAIETEHLELFKEHLLSLFEDYTLTTKTETITAQSSKEEEDPQEISSQDSEEEPQEIQTPDIEKIDGSLVYNHVNSICYVAGKNKNRLDNYGSYLTRILDIAEKYTVSNKPSFFDSKYELRIEGIDFDSAFHLQNFNLSKEYNHSVNKGARDVWSNRVREVEPAYKALPKAIAIEDVQLGAIVTSDPAKLKDKQYKVIQKVKMGGINHIECICIYNREMPTLVGNTDYLKDIYPVDLFDVKIDPRFSCVEESGAQFQQPEEEVAMTEDVQIYVPKPASERKNKPVEVSIFELGAGDVVHRGIGDSQYEVIGTARKDNNLYAECRLISSTTRAASIGNVYFFKDGLYLVEEEQIKPEPELCAV